MREDRLLVHAQGVELHLVTGQWAVGGPGGAFRWRFSAITPDSFEWSCHLLADFGWRLAEVMHARRRP